MGLENRLYVIRLRFNESSIPFTLLDHEKFIMLLTRYFEPLILPWEPYGHVVLSPNALATSEFLVL